MRIRRRSGRLVGPAGPVASDVAWATRPWSRYRGVIGRPPLGPSEALVITPCRRVHTAGVGYPLDAVFCDARLAVLHVETLEPGGLSRKVRRAACCIELAGGRAAACGIVVGSRLSFEVDPA